MPTALEHATGRASSAMASWIRQPWLAAVLAALLLRGALIGFVPPEGIEYGDMHVYHQVAQRLSQSGDAWFREGGEFGYRAPMYFAYLAAFYRITGLDSYRGGEIANLCLVVVLLILLYHVALASFGRAVAMLAVWTRAVLPTFVVSDLFIMTELPFNVFLLAVLLVILRREAGELRVRDVVALGVLTGTAILTREYAKGLVAILLVFVAAQGKGLRGRIGLPALLGLAMLITLLPWMWRNTVVWGSPLPLSLTTGVNLHMGNHPHSTGAYSEFQDPGHVMPPDIEFGTRAYNAWHRERAVEYMVEAPGRTLRMAFWKIAILVWPRWHRQELVYADLLADAPPPLIISLVAASGPGTLALWVLGVVGVAARPIDRFAWMLAIVLAYTCLTVVAAYGNPRYAQPVHLLLVPPAAWTLLYPRTAWRQLVAQRLRLYGAACALGLLMLLWATLAIQKMLAP